MSYPVTKAAKRVAHELHGVVVSAGLMQKTVKVRVGGQKYSPKLQKVLFNNFPLASARLNDGAYRCSRHQKHT